MESPDASSNQEAKSIGRTVLPGQRKCKKGAAEIGKLEASSLSIFLEIFLILHEKVENFYNNVFDN